MDVEPPVVKPLGAGGEVVPVVGHYGLFEHRILFGVLGW